MRAAAAVAYLAPGVRTPESRRDAYMLRKRIRSEGTRAVGVEARRSDGPQEFRAERG